MWGKVAFVFITELIQFLFKKLAEHKARRKAKRHEKDKNSVPVDKGQDSKDVCAERENATKPKGA